MGGGQCAILHNVFLTHGINFYFKVQIHFGLISPPTPPPRKGVTVVPKEHSPPPPEARDPWITFGINPWLLTKYKLR